MRNKFSELINSGVASFNYSPTNGNIPEQDPISRTYNNIFSMASDTHMSYVDGHRYITGHIIKTPKWDRFVYSPVASLGFENAGYWCVGDFMDKNHLKMTQTILNGDVAIEVSENIDYNPGPFSNTITPTSFTTSESNIPQPIGFLTTDNNSMRIKDHFQKSKSAKELVEKMNNDMFIKGDNWFVLENKIVGKINNTAYILTF